MGCYRSAVGRVKSWLCGKPIVAASKNFCEKDYVREMWCHGRENLHDFTANDATVILSPPNAGAAQFYRATYMP
jgi:hypothetical protein